MRDVRSILVAGICILVFLMGLAREAFSADRRVALVVGNAAYRNPNLVLTNPKNDAEDITAALRDLDFEVVETTDARKQDFDRALADFARLATGADVAVFFYAGHALQFQGRNYLMPIDAELEDEISLRYQMESVDDVRAALDRVSGIKIMILDACRNNPAADMLRRKVYGESRSLNQTRGLARIDRGQGIVVAFSTAADEVAMDGRGRNSPYTAALIKRLREPGLEVEIMFRRVAADVNAQTSGQQRPETYISLISEYYLNQKDRIAWEKIKSSEDASVFRDYVAQYPTSVNIFEARSRLRELERAAREKQLKGELAQREAERAREQEAQRVRLAGLERERLEREAAEQERARAEAARKREEDERRSKAEAEKRQEEERARLAALERGREAARQAEQRARAEEARKREEEQRAAMEAANKRREQEEQQRANAERTRLEQEAARRAQEAESKRLAALQPAASSDANCQRETERLTRLRSAPAADDIVRFERELTCERLRPQVVRLRESIVGPGRETATVAPKAKPAATPDEQRTRAESSSEEMNAGIRVQVHQPPVSNASAGGSEESCASDGQKLAHLRTTRSQAEITRFQRELTCEKLRPQLQRLIESMDAR